MHFSINDEQTAYFREKYNQAMKILMQVFHRNVSKNTNCMFTIPNLWSIITSTLLLYSLYIHVMERRVKLIQNDLKVISIQVYFKPQLNCLKLALHAMEFILV